MFSSTDLRDLTEEIIASAGMDALFDPGNYWQAPDKTKLTGDIKLWEEKVQNYILATYAKKNPTGLAGGNVFGVTASMTGNSRN